MQSMRRFNLVRLVDVSGVSGIGSVAEGVLFSNGKVALSWTTKYTSIVIYDSIEMVDNIHGHNGSTVIKWIDDES